MSSTAVEERRRDISHEGDANSRRSDDGFRNFLAHVVGSDGLELNIGRSLSVGDRDDPVRTRYFTFDPAPEPPSGKPEIEEEEGGTGMYIAGDAGESAGKIIQEIDSVLVESSANEKYQRQETAPLVGRTALPGLNVPNNTLG